MFFKRAININIDEKIIKKNRIPILIKDKQWNHIMEGNKTRGVQGIAKRLEGLVNEEKILVQQLDGLKQTKEKLMNKILHLSDLLNTKGQEDVLEELEACREDINRINAEIDLVKESIDTHHIDIEEINLHLLKETIKIAYKDIKTNDSKLSAIDREIAQLREKLGDLRDEKVEVEQRIESLYSFLHMMMGHEEMEKLDLHYSIAPKD
ncbi:hypothetical protein [Clostridium formicaceticum]|uniref:Chromosome partition protein Smc n=1 Tax=Clostridium formicaceticum TaxID=1497 RepID=A0AAC9RQ99_9CLOT|nr:hypothetical protein [Clostridium formicaceticum]AOY74841.1 hypothetical protein BJL90_02035 [Clostridium formicaceticum]ARE89238.1 Chromosome partition protein Smc [Clostridium formicaceticum]